MAGSSIDINEAVHDDPPRSRAHVVMMVANDVTADTRVRKIGESLASTGVDVTIIGLDHRGDGFDDTVGLANLVVRKTGRKFRNARFRLLGGRTKTYWIRSKLAFTKEEFQLQQRDAASQIEWIREDAREQRQSVGGRATALKQRSLDRYSSARLALKRKGRGGNRAARLEARGMLRFLDLRYQIARVLQRNRSKVDLKLVQTVPRERERLIRRVLRVRKFWLDFRVGRLKRRLIRGDRPNGNWPSTRLRRGNWRRELPELDDYEATLGPLLDGIDAAVFHAHDVHLLGVATRAAARARYRGIETRVIYDAHEYVAGLARYSKRMVEAYTSVEREYLSRVDRVITVSEPLADLIQEDFDLERRPDVVLNIPVVGGLDGHVPSLHGVAGVPLDDEIMVYSGGIDEARNVHTIVAALPFLADNVHLVLVAQRETNYVLSLFDLAEELGVSARLHMAPFVAPNEVVRYLSEASIGVHAMISSKMNHQIALPNKLFEYLHAGLPMCVSDNRAMMDFVTETGVGEWFEAEDPESLARAVATVLADRDKYVRARYEDPELLDRFSWNRQAERMVNVYREVLGEPDLQLGRFSIDDDTNGPDPMARKVRLAIGPLNQAGQADLWARGLVRNVPGVAASVFMVVRPEKILFPASHPVAIADWWDPRWQKEHQASITRDFTHVLFESGLTILGGSRGAYFEENLEALRAANVESALVFHGSDIRSPEIHRELMAVSPFHVRDDFTDRLEASTTKMLDLARGFDGRVFVSTKDLIDYLPHGEWLPQVVDVDRWALQPIRLGERRAVVASTFTNRRLKGAEHVDAVCKEFGDEGRIEYRRYANVPQAKMPGVIEDVDVLIDGVVLGLYGTTSVEGMAAGRLVLANIDRVIDKPGEIPPIVNVNPSNLSDILQDIEDRPDHYREIAARGPEYVRRYHDGRYSAVRLAGFLGIDLPSSLWSDGPADTENQS